MNSRKPHNIAESVFKSARGHKPQFYNNILI